MKYMTRIITLAMLSFALAGCTDAFKAKFSALGGTAEVTCYSGNTLIYQGVSTGVVKSSEQSDGYYFVDKKDNKLKEVSGNCIIVYLNY